MGEPQYYPVDIIKRTKEILKNNYEYFRKQDREVTFLINCLLGLVVTIAENERAKQFVFKQNIDDNFLAFIPDTLGFIGKAPSPEDWSKDDLIDADTQKVKSSSSFQVFRKKDLKGSKTKYWFINKIRNGIAHQNIDAGADTKGNNKADQNEDSVHQSDDGNKWTHVRLWNTSSSGIDFVIVFTIEQLLNFADELAQQYLQAVAENHDA